MRHALKSRCVLNLNHRLLPDSLMLQKNIDERICPAGYESDLQDMFFYYISL